MKNWIIKRLGGVTIEEHDRRINRFEDYLKAKQDRFDKFVSDLKEDGVDVDRHLEYHEKTSNNLSSWDVFSKQTSQICYVNQE